MTNPATPPSSTTHPLETILRLCAAATPQPWYPSDYAKATGTVRDELDPHLNRLRLGGLICLTDWIKDRGQGYVLTPEGTRVLQNPRELAQLAGGRMPELRPAVEDTPTSREVSRSQWDRGGIILDDLQRPQRPVVTNLLLAVNIVWFLAGVVMAQAEGVPVKQYLDGKGIGVGEIVHRLGALSSTDLVRGQWWRLLTCCFVHYGLIHLGVNMVSLWMVGSMLERMWGRGRYLAIYLIAGLGGSCIVMIVGPMTQVEGAALITQVAGASGALWGIMASAAVWILLNRPYLPPELSSAWLRNLLTVFLLNAFISMMPGISASAHFGGGFVGAVAGFLANSQRFGSPNQRRLGLIGLVLYPVLCVAGLRGDMAVDPRWVEIVWHTEANGFRNDAAESVWDAGNDAKRAYQKVLPLITNYGPKRRDPEDVRKARAILAEQQTELEQAAMRLTGAGPYRTAAVEQARLAGIAYVRALIEMCPLAQTCLEGGEDWKRQEKELLAQMVQVQDLRTAWVEALRKIDLVVTKPNGP